MDKTKLTVGVAITLALLIGSGATYYLSQDDDAYYCESRNIVMICEKLSSGIGTRCYYEGTYKVCNEGWEEIVMDQEIDTQVQPDADIPSVDSFVAGKRWLCSPESCVRIE